MAELPDNKNQKEPSSYTPASPVKRIIAWVGVAYMLIFVALNLYPFFHGGTYLRGLAPLLVCPGAAGLAVIAVWQFRRPECTYSKKACMALLAAACGVILVIGLVQGVPALRAGLGVGACKRVLPPACPPWASRLPTAQRPGWLSTAVCCWSRTRS